MARERPTASDVSPPALTALNGGKPAPDVPPPTRAQAHALRRSAPQTHASLTEHFEPLIASDARRMDRGRDRVDALSEDCIHTVYRAATGNWANEAGSGQRIYGVYATKQESVRKGQELARTTQTRHLIHNLDGTVSSFNP